MTPRRLSDAQTRIVEHGEGPLLVVAGPGSGKTRVLTERVRRLLTSVPGHFRVLALTFTNKAASEMKERLEDVAEIKSRSFIGTLHAFCQEMLADRGRAVGVNGQPQIFEHAQDRKQIMLEAALADPALSAELAEAPDTKERGKLIERWLRSIALTKTHPLTANLSTDPLGQRVLEAYDSGLRACGAYDFDDLLLLGYRLLTENPKIADFYRRLYGYICIDEAQDLNEAQYALLCALCGSDYRNVMLVGDPKQSIYGFNTSSPKFMDQFVLDFGAKQVELTENFRSSAAVVSAARSLVPAYMVEAQLPIRGTLELLVGSDEADEATEIGQKLQELIAFGHADLEDDVTYSRCAVLGRTRYQLLAVEEHFREKGIAFYKRLSARVENESPITEDFLLSLRILGNPKDRLHLNTLLDRWKATSPSIHPADAQGVIAIIEQATLANDARGVRHGILDALRSVKLSPSAFNLTAALNCLKKVGEALDAVERRALYEDIEVLTSEWDQHLRNGGAKDLGAFLSSLALGTSRPSEDGVALLTIHSSKGLEFDVVFVVGMAEGVFPDYRARGDKAALAEEQRNAFVAITRSKRLLYLSYPRTREMPWGEVWQCMPSPYLHQTGLIA
jgi:DNA helicase-2/ATP-dependent DNA helicase PcrA